MRDDSSGGPGQRGEPVCVEGGVKRILKRTLFSHKAMLTPCATHPVGQIQIYRNFIIPMSQCCILFTSAAATETLSSLRGRRKVKDVFVVCTWNIWAVTLLEWWSTDWSLLIIYVSHFVLYEQRWESCSRKRNLNPLQKVTAKCFYLPLIDSSTNIQTCELILHHFGFIKHWTKKSQKTLLCEDEANILYVFLLNHILFYFS